MPKDDRYQGNVKAATGTVSEATNVRQQPARTLRKQQQATISVLNCENLAESAKKSALCVGREYRGSVAVVPATADETL